MGKGGDRIGENYASFLSRKSGCIGRSIREGIVDVSCIVSLQGEKNPTFNEREYMNVLFLVNAYLGARIKIRDRILSVRLTLPTPG